jgi:hypothetical protein
MHVTVLGRVIAANRARVNMRTPSLRFKEVPVNWHHSVLHVFFHETVFSRAYMWVFAIRSAM